MRDYGLREMVGRQQVSSIAFEGSSSTPLTLRRFCLFAGMIRVLATMQNSQYANLLSNEMADLKSWTREILVASFATLKVCSLFRFIPSTFRP